jgi:hypothetical protein
VFPKSNTYVDGEITRVVAAMEGQEVTNGEYSKLLNRLEGLQKIRMEEKPDKASPNTILTAAANLVGILLIIRHEHVNVITSRAMNLVLKSK